MHARLPGRSIVAQEKLAARRAALRRTGDHFLHKAARSVNVTETGTPQRSCSDRIGKPNQHGYQTTFRIGHRSDEDHVGTRQRNRSADRVRTSTSRPSLTSSACSGVSSHRTSSSCRSTISPQIAVPGPGDQTGINFKPADDPVDHRDHVKCSNSASDESNAAWAARWSASDFAYGQFGFVQTLLGQNLALGNRLSPETAGFVGGVLGAFEECFLQSHVGPRFVIVHLHQELAFGDALAWHNFYFHDGMQRHGGDACSPPRSALSSPDNFDLTAGGEQPAARRSTVGADAETCGGRRSISNGQREHQHAAPDPGQRTHQNLAVGGRTVSQPSLGTADDRPTWH